MNRRLLWLISLIGGCAFAYNSVCYGQSIISASHAIAGVETKGYRLLTDAPVRRLRRAWGQFMLPVAQIEKAKGFWLLRMKDDPEVPLRKHQFAYISWGSQNNAAYVYFGVAIKDATPKSLYMLKRLLELFSRQYRWKQLLASFHKNEGIIVKESRQLHVLRRKQQRTKDSVTKDAQRIPLHRLSHRLHRHYVRRDSLLGALSKFERR